MGAAAAIQATRFLEASTAEAQEAAQS